MQNLPRTLRCACHDSASVQHLRTHFLGRYFVEVLVFLNDQVFKKPCKIVVLDKLITSGKDIASIQDLPNVTFIEHDVVHPFQWDEPLHYIIQAAGIASPYYYRKYPLETLEVAIPRGESEKSHSWHPKHNRRCALASRPHRYGEVYRQ